MILGIPGPVVPGILFTLLKRFNRNLLENLFELYDVGYVLIFNNSVMKNLGVIGSTLRYIRQPKINENKE
jgi:hypothetical protein